MRILNTYSNVDRVAELIGSRGPNGDWGTPDSVRKTWKKHPLHRNITSRLKSDEFSPEIHSLIEMIGSKLN